MIHTPSEPRNNHQHHHPLLLPLFESSLVALLLRQNNDDDNKNKNSSSSSSSNGNPAYPAALYQHIYIALPSVVVLLLVVTLALAVLQWIRNVLWVVLGVMVVVAAKQGRDEGMLLSSSSLLMRDGSS